MSRFRLRASSGAAPSRPERRLTLYTRERRGPLCRGPPRRDMRDALLRRTLMRRQDTGTLTAELRSKTFYTWGAVREHVVRWCAVKWMFSM